MRNVFEQFRILANLLFLTSGRFLPLKSSNPQQEQHSSIVTCLFYELTLFVRLFCLRVTTLLIQQLQLSSSSSLNASLHNTTNKTEEAIHTRIKYYDEYIQRSVLFLKSRRQLSKTANVILAESWSASESHFFVAFTTSIGICTQSKIHSGVIRAILTFPC